MVVSAWVDGTSLVIVFNEDLGDAASLANSAFEVSSTPQGGSQQTLALDSGTAPALGTNSLTLTLADAVTDTPAGLTVAYTKPGTGTTNKVADRFGNQAASFTVNSDVPRGWVSRRCTPTRRRGSRRRCSASSARW